jgi:hypothetical protein
MTASSRLLFRSSSRRRTAALLRPRPGRNAPPRAPDAAHAGRHGRRRPLRGRRTKVRSAAKWAVSICQQGHFYILNREKSRRRDSENRFQNRVVARLAHPKGWAWGIESFMQLPDVFCEHPFGPREQSLQIRRRLLCCLGNEGSRHDRTSSPLQEDHETWCTCPSTSPKPTPPRCTG